MSKKKAVDLLRAPTLKEFLGGAEELGFKAVRIQQETDSVECAWIIFDDCDDMSRSIDATSSSSVGSRANRSIASVRGAAAFKPVEQGKETRL